MATATLNLREALHLGVEEVYLDVVSGAGGSQRNLTSGVDLGPRQHIGRILVSTLAQATLANGLDDETAKAIALDDARRAAERLFPEDGAARVDRERNRMAGMELSFVALQVSNES